MLVIFYFTVWNARARSIGKGRIQALEAPSNVAGMAWKGIPAEIRLRARPSDVMSVWPWRGEPMSALPPARSRVCAAGAFSGVVLAPPTLAVAVHSFCKLLGEFPHTIRMGPGYFATKESIVSSVIPSTVAYGY